MNRKLLAVLLAGAIAAPALASAQIGTHISVAGGLAIPSGDLGDVAKTGYNLAAGLNIGVPLMPVGVRLEGAYNSFDAKGTTSGTSGSQNIASGTVNGT